MEKTKTALTKDQNNLKKQHQQLIGRFTSLENCKLFSEII